MKQSIPMGCQASKDATVDGSVPPTDASQPQPMPSGTQLLSGSPGVVTKEVIQLVRENWAQFKEKNDEIAPRNHAVLLFVKLFEIVPEAKDLFSFLEEVTMDNLEQSVRLHEHAQRVTDALSTVVNALDDMKAVKMAVNSLGYRHVSYGVKAEYIDAAVIGLEYALETTLGDDLTPKHKAAWKIVLSKVAELMKDGMNEKQKAESMESFHSHSQTV